MIYLDHAATTPVAAEVLAAMLPCLQADGWHGNAASEHAAGLQAREVIELARGQVAALVGAGADEIIWTSGATESNNLAIQGALSFYSGRGRHIVTAKTEHKAVLDTCRHLESQGCRVSYLVPQADGRVSAEQVQEALTPETTLVSLMWVNNETGIIQDIAAIAAVVKAHGALLHVDGAQAAGKVAIDMRAVPVDLLSLTAHKVYGPKGMGALYVRRRPRARLVPLLHGGGHEQGMRSGTLATHQIVGMGAAFALAGQRMAGDRQQLDNLRTQLWSQLSELPRIHRNGDAALTVPHILNVSFEGVDGESLRAALQELALSSGSACSAATQESSYVLRALGRSDALANASLRFSPGRDTTAAHIAQAGTLVCEAVRRLRRLSPEWQAA